MLINTVPDDFLKYIGFNLIFKIMSITNMFMLSIVKNGLRILTGTKHCQIKLLRIEKVRIWAFGLLLH